MSNDACTLRTTTSPSRIIASRFTASSRRRRTSPRWKVLRKELRDRFGPLPPPAELLLQLAELKILASDKSVTTIEVEEDKLKITRHGDFITLGGKFPRLTKKEAKARLKEIKRLLLAI